MIKQPSLFVIVVSTVFAISLAACAPVSQQEMSARSAQKEQAKQIERETRQKEREEKLAKKRAEEEAKRQERLAKQQAKIDAIKAEEEAKRQARLAQQQQKWDNYREAQLESSARTTQPSPSHSEPAPTSALSYGLPTTSNQPQPPAFNSSAPAAKQSTPTPNQMNTGQVSGFPSHARSQYPKTQPAEFAPVLIPNPTVKTPAQPSVWPIANQVVQVVNLTGRLFASGSEESSVYQQIVISERLGITLAQSSNFVYSQNQPAQPGMITVQGKLIITLSDTAQLVNTLTLMAYDASAGTFLANVKNRVETQPTSGIKPSLQALLDHSVTRLAEELDKNNTR